MFRPDAAKPPFGVVLKVLGQMGRPNLGRGPRGRRTVRRIEEGKAWASA